jgi:hypothetical protein
MISIKSTGNKTKTLPLLLKVDVPIALDASVYDGAMVRGSDDNIYLSTGSYWKIIQGGGGGTSKISINSFAFTNHAVNEMGLSVSPSMSWSLTLGSGDLISQTINNEVISLSNRTWTDTNSISSNTVYTLVVADDNGSANSSIESVFIPRVYWGYSGTEITTSSEVINLQYSKLSSNYNFSFTLTPDEESYIYFCYPSSYGNFNYVKAYGFMTSTVSNTINVTTNTGYNTDYIVCRLSQTQNQTISIEVI